MTHNILIVDANQLHADSLRPLPEGTFNWLRAEGSAAARKYMDQPIDLVVCDLTANPNAAFELLREWSQHVESPQFIFLVDAGDIQSAIEGMKLGAVDCLVKPVDVRHLQQLILQTVGEGGAGRAHSGAANGVGGPPSSAGNGATNLEIPEGTSLEDLERAAVEKALLQHHGNRTHAARELGISVRTLQRKLKAWRLPVLSLHHFSSGPNTLASTTPYVRH